MLALWKVVTHVQRVGMVILVNQPVQLNRISLLGKAKNHTATELKGLSGFRDHLIESFVIYMRG